jgi:hypothetical protein
MQVFFVEDWFTRDKKLTVVNATVRRGQAQYFVHSSIIAEFRRWSHFDLVGERLLIINYGHCENT